jgi:lysophospholipase L1-like esterase
MRRNALALGSAVAVVILLGVVAYLRCSSPPTGALPEPPPWPAPSGPAAVRFIGRFDKGDAAGPRFAWSGSMIHARFRGTQVSMKLHDTGPNTYSVWIDKLPARKLTSSPDQQIHVLATGLPAGEHDVTIAKNTEASVGDAQFLGFDFGPGGELLPPRVRERRLEFVGDSITAGFGIEGPNAQCPFSPATENVELTYAALLARAFGADATMLAWSCKGITRNCDGTTAGTMPELYTRTLPQYAWSKWEFGGYAPDAVIVALGTNDFAQGDPGEGPFVKGYVELLKSIRASYPQAYILAVAGPMITDDALVPRERLYVTEAVKARNDASDARVASIIFPPHDMGKDGAACGEHPSAATHRKMAEEMATKLKKALAW